DAFDKVKRRRCVSASRTEGSLDTVGVETGHGASKSVVGSGSDVTNSVKTSHFEEFAEVHTEYGRPQFLEPTGETLDRITKVLEWSEVNPRKFELLNLSKEFRNTIGNALNHRKHRREELKYLHESRANDGYEPCGHRYYADDGFGNKSECFTNELNNFSAANELGSQVQEARDVID